VKKKYNGRDVDWNYEFYNMTPRS
jgi:hypothetical protein